MGWEQLAILALGATAIWMANSPNDGPRRCASLFGLAGQPLWLAETFRAEQWGMFALAIAFTVAWARGAYHAIAHSPPEASGERPAEEARNASRAWDKPTRRRYPAPAPPPWKKGVA